jgi:hypothetical protein
MRSWTAPAEDRSQAGDDTLQPLSWAASRPGGTDFHDFGLRKFNFTRRGIFQSVIMSRGDLGEVAVVCNAINQTSFTRLILRAVLRHVNPLVIRQVSVSDPAGLREFNGNSSTILAWRRNLGDIFRGHTQGFNSFRPATRSKILCDFRLLRQEKLLHVWDSLPMQERDVQVLDIQEGPKEDREPARLVTAAPRARVSRRSNWLPADAEPAKKAM